MDAYLVAHVDFTAHLVRAIEGLPLVGYTKMRVPEDAAHEMTAFLKYCANLPSATLDTDQHLPLYRAMVRYVMRAEREARYRTAHLSSFGGVSEQPQRAVPTLLSGPPSAEGWFNNETRKALTPLDLVQSHQHALREAEAERLDAVSETLALRRANDVNLDALAGPELEDGTVLHPPCVGPHAEERLTAAHQCFSITAHLYNDQLTSLRKDQQLLLQLEVFLKEEACTWQGLPRTAPGTLVRLTGGEPTDGVEPTPRREALEIIRAEVRHYAEQANEHTVDAFLLSAHCTYARAQVHQLEAKSLHENVQALIRDLNIECSSTLGRSPPAVLPLLPSPGALL